MAKTVLLYWCLVSDHFCPFQGFVIIVVFVVAVVVLAFVVVEVVLFVAVVVGLCH